MSAALPHPVGAAAHVRQSMAKDGTWMIVEPFANDQLKDNLNPVGLLLFNTVVYSLLTIPESKGLAHLLIVVGTIDN